VTRPQTTFPSATVPLEADVAASLAALPASAGVGQLLGPEGQNLILGRPANLRRWAASHLGAAPVTAKQALKRLRPRTDLRSVTAAVAFAPTTSGFQQRLVYERVMARYVAGAERRDLKTPAYLHLDPQERFPRVTIRPASLPPAQLFGPFRDRRAAERALKELHKLFPLRPCDYVFEPAAELALGLGCLYAQVRTCAAPCLVRISEEAYRGLAAEAAALLAEPSARPAEVLPWLKPWIAPAGGHGLVVEVGKSGLELYPVRAGTVLEAAAVSTAAEDLTSAIDALVWPARDEQAGGDWPWLSAWIHAPRKSGGFVPVADAADRRRLLAQVHESLGAPCAG